MVRGVRRKERVEIAGIEVGDWVRAFENCHDSTLSRIEWPDGGCYSDQYELTVRVFEIIRDEINKNRLEEAKRNGKRNRIRN